MTFACRRLRSWVHSLRPRAVEHNGVLTFRPMPLYLALMGLFDEDDRPEAEAEVFARLGNQLQLRELVSIDWWDHDHGPSEATILVAHTPEDGMFVLRVDDDLRAVALGPERSLQAVAADLPGLMFPQLTTRSAVLREVVVRYDVCWTMHDLAAIIQALCDQSPEVGSFLRVDLLVQQEATG